MFPYRTTAPCHSSPVVTMTLIVINIGETFAHQTSIDAGSIFQM